MKRSNQSRKPRAAQRRTKPAKKNTPRPQPSAGKSITRGLAGIANQFIPGSGSIVRGVSQLFGFGAYTTADAEAILASKVPSMNATLDRGIRVSHHEYVGDVTSSTSFSVHSYPINPGVQVAFPWLSSVAASFQEYEINGLIFYFKSTSANALNSTNTALGQIIGAVQYNPYLPAPQDKISMLGLASASDGKPSESNIYPVECKADMVVYRSKLIRTGAVTDDLAKYDHGNFFLGSNGSQAAAVVGELHIVYDITLKKPRLIRESAANAWYYHEYSAEGKSSGADPFAGESKILVPNLPVVRTGSEFKIPKAFAVAGTKYCFRVYWSGVAAAVNDATMGLSNATFTTTVQGALSRINSPAAGVNSARYMDEMHIVVTASNVDTTLTFGNDSTIPTDSSWDVIVTEEA